MTYTMGILATQTSPLGAVLLLAAILLFVFLGMKSFAATADAHVNTLERFQPFLHPVGANRKLYKDRWAGLDPAGYAKPFEPGDVFAGISEEACDNTGGAAAAKKVKCMLDLAVVYALAGVTAKDIGKPVYATADDAIALTGHYDAYIGRIWGVNATNEAIIWLKKPGEEPPNGAGSIKLELTGHEQFSATGTDGATHGNIYIGTPGGGFEGKSILGAGISPNDAEDGGVKLAFDAVAEIALASVRTINDCLPVDKGIRMDVDLVVSDKGDDAALDVMVGLGTALTTDSEASTDHAAMVNLAAYHLDGNSDNILAESDNNVTDVAPVDTTIDNDSATDVPKRLTIIVRPTGAVEFWINGARVLSSTVFAVDPAAVLAAFVNMEKTANDTTAEVIFRNLRVTGGTAALAA